jgi:hypothetical protein
MSTKPNEINNLLALVREVCSIVGTGISPSQGELHHMTKSELAEKKFVAALRQFLGEYLNEDGVLDRVEARSIAESHIDNECRAAQAGR